MKLWGRALASYIRLVYRTSKVTIEPADPRNAFADHEPIIGAMWHGQFMMLPMLKPSDKPVKIMVARHTDAELIGQALLHFDAELVRGAGAGNRRKDRGGATALRQSLTALEENCNVALTADIPPGPARKAGAGIVTMARHSGRPIVPMAVATTRYISLNTWSRFTINLPFSKMAFVCGEPIYVSGDGNPETVEKARLEVESAMNRVTQRAYELAGADPVAATPANALPADIKLPEGLNLKLYKLLTRAAKPLVPYVLKKRAAKGKEDLSRQNERMGRPITSRPHGNLLWFHAASVGETNAILPLMRQLKEMRPDLNQLLTTGTVTSAGLAAKRMPEGAIHQYVPVDSPAFVEGFLKHWRPDMAFFAESEIWPNLLLQTSELNIPLFLLNGIMSNKSFRRWRKRSKMARAIFSRFTEILCQNNVMAKRFTRLGARSVSIVGNLKMDAPLLPVSEQELKKFKSMSGTRRIFLGASTHPGEDMLLAKAHKILREDIPDILTVIAPRHPERGEDIVRELQEMGLKVARRTTGETIEVDTDIYVADTIGELGLFYSLAPVTFVGGSIVKNGGQNPIEAIKLGAGVLTGPHWYNFNDSYRELFRLNGAREVLTSDTLASTARELLLDQQKLDDMNLHAQEAVRNLSGAQERSITEIEPHLPAPAPSDFTKAGIRRVS